MENFSSEAVPFSKKAGILSSLYIAQFLPIAFFLQTLPAFMRQQGISLELIGLTSLLGLPWMLKFLWSPLVDYYPLAKIGHYKSWIVIMQSLMVLMLIICALLNIKIQFFGLLTCLSMIVVFASTQDIAVDALAIGILTPQERGFGNAIQGGGNYLGAILGGGVLLVLLDVLGWQIGLLGMAGCTLILMLPVLAYQEQKSSTELSEKCSYLSENPISVAKYLTTFTSFCRRPNLGHWLFLLFFFYLGTSMTNTMFRPLLIDVGLSLSEIGWMYGTAAYSAGLIGAIVAGALIKLLGRKQSLLLSILLLVGANLFHLLPAWGFTSLLMLYIVSTIFNFTYGMVSVVLNTIMMDNTRTQTAGTDYTLQSTILFIGSLIAGGFSGFLATLIGYSGVFMLGGILTSINVILVAHISLYTPQV